jgi:uncharacterized membrane protein
MNSLWNRSSNLAAVVLVCGQAMGQGYSIQELPPLPGDALSFACGINASGVVVGNSRTGSVGQPVRWDNGVPTGLGTLTGSTWAVALDISADGLLIVGEANIGGNLWVPYVWDNGTLTPLPGPARNVVGCWQINDTGVIAGRAGGAANGIACRWEKVNGTWQFTPLSPLDGSTACLAWGIGNTGMIAGASLNTWDDARATLWDPVTLLPSLVPGFTGACTVTSINASGHLAGDFQISPGGAWHAQVHNGVSPTDLGTLTHPNSYAHRINDAGTVIGQSYADGVDPTGFPSDLKLAIIWRAGTMSAVNDVIPPGSGWDVKQLWDINESGRIAGYGRFNGLWRGCLLIPVCYANCDDSTGAPVLTANDFQCFLNQYAAGQSYANCDGSTGVPSLTANDFQCFLNKYAAGCS